MTSVGINSGWDAAIVSVVSRSRKRRGSGRVTPRQRPVPAEVMPVVRLEDIPGSPSPSSQDLLNILVGLVEARRGLELEVSGIVRAARAAGASWGQLGKALGVSAQAVHKRYGTTDEATSSTLRSSQGPAVGRLKRSPLTAPGPKSFTG